MFVTYTANCLKVKQRPNRSPSVLFISGIWNIESTLSPDLVLDFAVEYDEFERKRR